MNERASSSSPVHDEWTVILDGRYVVRFCGVNAQELATRQLHELAELLGFDDTPPNAAEKRASAEAPGETSGVSSADGDHRSPR